MAAISEAKKIDYASRANEQFRMAEFQSERVQKSWLYSKELNKIP